MGTLRAQYYWQHGKRLLIILLLLGLVGLAAYAQLRANRLEQRLAKLEALRHQLEENHRLLKQDYLQFLQSPNMNDKAFRKLLQLLEERDGVDLNTSGNSTHKITRINMLTSTLSR